MSLLDDFQTLDNNVGKESFIYYIENLSNIDTPAYWQAWYDILKEDFLQFSLDKRIQCLKVLREYFPKYNIWNTHIIVEDGPTPKYNICETLINVDVGKDGPKPKYLLDDDYLASSKEKYEGSRKILVGMSDTPNKNTQAYHNICSSIQKWIDYFTFHNADVFSEELSDVFSVLNKLDRHKQDSYTLIENLLIESISPKQIIREVLTPYLNILCIPWLLHGMFRDNYYLISDTEYINDLKFQHIVVETKYNEIKQYLERLIDCYN